MDRLRQTDRDRVAWLASRHPLELIHFPPSPKKFLHSFLGCLKSSRSRFKSFYFFRKKLRSFEGFDQMSAFWSMFWFKPFRNFLRKIAIFRTFDHWSEILSLSAGRPLSQGVCPSLALSPSPLDRGKWRNHPPHSKPPPPQLMFPASCGGGEGKGAGNMVIRGPTDH